MRRALCLYIPFLSTDRLRNLHSVAGTHVTTADRAPVATVEPHAQTLRVVHLNQAAYELRVRPGQTLADAKAVAPDLVVYADDPAADRRHLETLAVWTDCLSPTVHIEGDDSLIVDVTGCERLFEGEERLLHQAIDGVNAQGFTVRGTMADTLGGAWAMAHAHPEPAVISPPGQIAADLTPLPAWSLRIDDQTVADLASVGVQTVGSLLHLPRSSLASRFGEGLLDRIDQALGDVPEVLTPYRPQPVLSSRIHFGAGTTRIDVLREGIRRALEEFCEKLVRQVAGVRHMFATFYCPDGTSEACDASFSVPPSLRSVTLPLSLSQPTRSVKHLYSLLMVLLDRLHLHAPADSLALWATQIDPLDDRQEELFATGPGGVRGLGDLVDRLVVRLGPQAVVRPELLSEHQPERAFQYVPVAGLGLRGAAAGRDGGMRPVSTETVMERPGQRRRAEQSEVRLRRNEGSNGAAGFSLRGPTTVTATSERSESPRGLKPAAQGGNVDVALAGHRPLRLLPHPERVTVTAVVPEGPPIAFRLRGVQHAVADSTGPERIETGWWRGPHLKRDYYRITTEGGCRVWLFRERDTGDWFLHGWFD